MYNRFHKELRFFFSLLKRKNKQKRKEFAFHLYCKIPISPEDITFSINKTPPAGHTGGLSAVTLLFLQLKLGRKVSGGLLSLGKSAVAITAGRRADPLLSLLKRKKEAKKEKSSRSTCTARFQYHPKIIQETITIDSHKQKSPGGANRRLPPP